MKQVSRLILLLVVLLTGLPAWAATRKVTGTVTDLNGEPLTGASVMLVNSRTGCMADIDGHFSIQVPEGAATLKIALIGYQPQTVKVAANQSVVDIKMKEDSQTLEETVVVGYGTQKKVNLTGAVAAIGGKELDNRPATSLSTMLQGQVSGLNVSTSHAKPGSTSSLNIRGVTSINGASPLVMIDGAIGDLNSVDPNDVASISVIKDASAAAVYGARAAFGVILVTTKAGSESDGKATVRYNGRFGWDTPTTSTDFETRGYWHLRVLEDFYQGSNHTPMIPTYTDADWIQLLARVNDKTENPERPWVVEEETGNSAHPKRWKYYGNNDWWHTLFNDNRFTTQHNVSLSGGTKSIKYFVSGGLRHNDGIAKMNTDMYNAYNLRSKVEFKINKWASFENNTSFFGSKYSYQGDGTMENTIAYSAQGALAMLPLQNPDGSYLYNNPYSSYKPANGRGIVMSYGKHPGSQRKTDFQTMSRLNITPIKQLTFTGDFTYRFLQNRNMTRSNNIPCRQYPGEEMQYYTSGMGLDDLQEKQTTYNYYSVNVFGTYKDTFNDKHNLTVMAGYNWESRDSKSIGAYVMNLGIIDLNDISLAPNLDGAKVYGGQNEYSLMGWFGRINYDFDGKYLIELSGRYDGTSRFADGHRWGFFPSGSIGWRFSEENFFKPLQSWWSNGKLRFSYGSLGNQNISDYYSFLRKITTSTMSDYLFNTSGLSKSSASGAPVAGDLTWEKANQWDLGLDLGFFNNRLNFTGDIYIRDTKNMLTDGVALPAVYGATEPQMNAADLRTKGYEFSINWNDTFNLWDHPFTYNVGFNISNYSSKITRYDNPDKTFAKDYYVGKEFGEIWGYIVDGIFQTDEEAQEYANRIDLSYVAKRVEDGWQAGDLRFVDIDGDGKIGIGDPNKKDADGNPIPVNSVNNPGDRVKLGNSRARLQYGIRGGFNYCGIDASIFFNGVGNNYHYPQGNTLMFWGGFVGYQQPSYIYKGFKDDYWTEDNPNAYFPRPKANGATGGTLQFTNNRYLQNARYLRLKNVTVGYTLPKNWTRKASIEKVRIYFTGENLCYWSPMKKHAKYIDPEMMFNHKDEVSSDNTFYNMMYYPMSKTYMFGIDLQF